MLFGLALLPDASRLQTVVKIFLSSVPCFDWSRTAAGHFAQIRAQLQRIGQPIGILDTQIAAHALAENLVLVTNNTSHFGRIEGLKLDNWYERVQVRGSLMTASMRLTAKIFGQRAGRLQIEALRRAT